MSEPIISFVMNIQRFVFMLTSFTLPAYLLYLFLARLPPVGGTQIHISIPLPIATYTLWVFLL